jgi:hypothetical protein
MEENMKKFTAKLMLGLKIVYVAVAGLYLGLAIHALLQLQDVQVCRLPEKRQPSAWGGPGENTSGKRFKGPGSSY